jgi:hypothetical protein
MSLMNLIFTYLKHQISLLTRRYHIRETISHYSTWYRVTRDHLKLRKNWHLHCNICDCAMLRDIFYAMSFASINKIYLKRLIKSEICFVFSKRWIELLLDLDVRFKFRQILQDDRISRLNVERRSFSEASNWLCYRNSKHRTSCVCQNILKLHDLNTFCSSQTLFSEMRRH